jgi:uncharacterized membrane protein YjjB (DUF3815 family)
MILLAVAFGLSFIVEVAGVDISRQPPAELAYTVKLVLRAAASFIAASGLAISFNSPARTALAVGCLALVANELRLVLTDTGLMIAPAAFFGCSLHRDVGGAAWSGSSSCRVWQRPWHRLSLMIPGVYAFEMIVLLNRGQVLETLQAAALSGFAVGALATGLATALLFSR